MTGRRATTVALLAIVAAAASSAFGSRSDAAPTPTCVANHLHLRAGAYGEAAQQYTQTFTATNTGAGACRLAGWPTLRLRRPSGGTTPAPAIRVVQGRPASHPFTTVILRPGGAASFDVFGADYDVLADKPCPTVHGLLIALPGVGPVPVGVSLPFCTAFSVAPLIAGTSDRAAWSGVWAKRWCRIRQFGVSVGPQIGEATGQHTLALRLVNRGAACTLFGTPALWFEDARGFIPFQLGYGGDQVIAADPRATPIQVRTGGSAWVAMNHYRCDRGDERAAAVVLIGLVPVNPGDTVRVRIRDPYEHLAYCGKGDPGSTITVSRFVPTLAAALRHRLH